MASKRHIKRTMRAGARANTSPPEDMGAWLDNVTDEELADSLAALYPSPPCTEHTAAKPRPSRPLFD